MPSARKKAKVAKKPIATYFTASELETLDREVTSRGWRVFIHSRTTLVQSLVGTYFRDQGPADPTELPHAFPPKEERRTVAVQVGLDLVKKLDEVGARLGASRALVLRNLCLLRLADPRWAQGCEETAEKLFPPRPVPIVPAVPPPGIKHLGLVLTEEVGRMLGELLYDARNKSLGGGSITAAGFVTGLIVEEHKRRGLTKPALAKASPQPAPRGWVRQTEITVERVKVRGVG